jgi:hypothetical protein
MSSARTISTRIRQMTNYRHAIFLSTRNLKHLFWYETRSGHFLVRSLNVPCRLREGASHLPNLQIVHLWQAAAYAQSGQVAEARTVAATVLQMGMASSFLTGCPRRAAGGWRLNGSSSRRARCSVFPGPDVAYGLNGENLRSSTSVPWGSFELTALVQNEFWVLARETRVGHELPRNGPGSGTRLSTATNSGITIKTSGSWTMRPEMIAIASGCCIAEPWPIPSASGNKARIAARVVMAIGRKRLTPA